MQSSQSLLENLNEKNFFTETFQISLKLYKRGGVNGFITHFHEAIRLQKPFEGVYTVEESKIRLAFVIDWTNVNLNFKSLTAYNGVIVNCSGQKECLCLRWLLVNEPETSIGSLTESGLEILFNDRKKYHLSETKTIITQLGNNIFW